jgi:hypothetical protein
MFSTLNGAPFTVLIDTGSRYETHCDADVGAHTSLQ